MSREAIDSPANQVVKSLKALAEAKARRARQLFIVEGVRAVEDGLRAGFKPEICLYNNQMLARTERGAKLSLKLARLDGTSLYEASERALQAVADTVHPQGVVAAFPLIRWNEQDLTNEPFFALICDDIRDPGNMGTLLRTAEAAGVHAVWTSSSTVDIYNPKVVRASMGTHFRLPIFFEQPWPKIVAALAERGISSDRLFCTNTNAKLDYDKVEWIEPSAVVISNEAHGLSAEARQVCVDSASISIPMLAETESLNAAIAGAVIMFEAARQRRQGGNHE